MITYIPNIDQWQHLGLELLVMIQYNIYILYINATGSKLGCYNIRSCDNYQRIRQQVHDAEIHLHPRVPIEPFEKLDLYFVGTITPMPRNKMYILFFIDYVTKCLEDKSFLWANEQLVTNFLSRNIYSIWRGKRNSYRSRYPIHNKDNSVYYLSVPN